MNPKTENCSDCSKGCLKCDTNGPTCTKCESSFKIVDGKCECKNSTYLNRDLKRQDWNCKPCWKTCLWCSGATSRDCTKCSENENRLLILPDGTVGNEGDIGKC